MNFVHTVELTRHREMLRVTGVMGIDEQTCSQRPEQIQPGVLLTPAPN